LESFLSVPGNTINILSNEKSPSSEEADIREEIHQMVIQGGGGSSAVKAIKAKLDSYPDEETRVEVVNTKSEDGLTALHHALMNAMEEIVLMLISDYHADPWLCDGCLHFAVNLPTAQAMKLMLAQKPAAAMTSRNKHGMLPVHVASTQGKCESLQSLLDSPQTPEGRAEMAVVRSDEAEDGSWETPVHLAAKGAGSLECVKAIVERHADAVHCVNSNGRTCLHIAAIQGNVPLTQYLLSKKADPAAKDMDQLTPMHHAFNGEYMELTNMLKAAQ